MRVAIVPAFVMMLALATTQADARPTAPCTGCTLDVPDSKNPVPLVVVLHGDREHASAAAARWRSAVKKRGWALLSLECPRDRECKDSFWEWDGDPSWVIDQVVAVTKQIPIDPDRMFLIGWSGGASYIGAHAVAWAGTFAAVVFHGGGMAPRTADCPKRLPAYFLVGDRNPLHRLAKDLRAYFDQCKQAVTWDLLKRADHAKEETALGPKKTQAILTWLEHQHG